MLNHFPKKLCKNIGVKKSVFAGASYAYSPEIEY